MAEFNKLIIIFVQAKVITWCQNIFVYSCLMTLGWRETRRRQRERERSLTILYDARLRRPLCSKRRWFIDKRRRRNCSKYQKVFLSQFTLDARISTPFNPLFTMLFTHILLVFFLATLFSLPGELSNLLRLCVCLEKKKKWIRVMKEKTEFSKAF